MHLALPAEQEATGATVVSEKVAAAVDLHNALSRVISGAQAMASLDGNFLPGQYNEPVSKGTCHFGHYTQPQIIGSLLHIAVQLALFPCSQGQHTVDQSVQTVQEQMSQTVEEHGCQATCDMVEQGVQAIHEQNCQTDALDLGFQTSSRVVRIGGGFHVVKSLHKSSLSSPSSWLPCGSPLKVTHALRLGESPVKRYIEDGGRCQSLWGEDQRRCDGMLAVPVGNAIEDDQASDVSQSCAAQDCQALGSPGQTSPDPSRHCVMKGVPTPSRPRSGERARPRSADSTRSTDRRMVYPRVGSPITIRH